MCSQLKVEVLIKWTQVEDEIVMPPLHAFWFEGRDFDLFLDFFFFSCIFFFFSRPSPPWAIRRSRRRKRSKSAKHSEHLRWTVYSGLQIQKKKKKCSCKVADPRGGRVEWPAKSNFSVCVFTRVAIAGGKCIVSAPGSSLCYGSSVTHYSVAWCALCKAAKKINKESQDYSMARWEITYFTPGSHITADYRARTRRKVVLNNADIRQSECLFDDRPGKQLTQRYSIEVNS